MENKINVLNNSKNTKKVTLDNGLRVVYEEVDFFETVSIGIWINVGSKHEKEEQNGYSHLIEHMLFKGTQDRDSIQIAKEIDRVGGYLNAFTTREYTCLYVNMVSKYWDVGIEILFDMLLNSNFNKSEMEREKQVILEEIRMYDDAPDQLVHDLFIENIWKNHSIGRPIMGTVKNISKVKKKKLMEFYSENYHVDNFIISIAGNFDINKILKILNTVNFPKKEQKKEKKENVEMYFDVGYKQRMIEQIYSCWGFKGISNNDIRRYKLFVFSTLFGGGTSSRLYHEIRERMGLCYAIYTFNSSFSTGGVFGIYSVTNPKNFKKLIKSIKKQALLIARKGVSEEELYIAKEQIKGNIIFSKESLEARMNRNAKNELIFGREITYDEAINNIEKITIKDIKDIASYLFESKLSAFYSVGPRGHQEFLNEVNI